MISLSILVLCQVHKLSFICSNWDMEQRLQATQSTEVTR